jgi:hypothetical protein
MAKQNQVINPLARVGWARLPAGPVYHARELPDDPGTFTCQARGAGQWTAEQLQGWAELVGAEVVLVECLRRAQGCNVS